MPGLPSITSAVGCWYGPGRFAGLHSASVAAHFLHVPCLWRDRPCRDVQQQTGVTLLHFREVQRLCCDRNLPCRLRRFSPRANQQTGVEPVLDVTEWCAVNCSHLASDEAGHTVDPRFGAARRMTADTG